MDIILVYGYSLLWSSPISPKAMVVSKDPSAPLVVIVGITGQQGGSVANALIESSKSYRLVGLTRDASKPSAHLWIEKGVKLRQVTLSADNKAAAIEAFDGADILFVSLAALLTHSSN